MRKFTYACMLGLSMCLCTSCSEKTTTSNDTITTDATNQQTDDTSDFHMEETMEPKDEDYLDTEEEVTFEDTSYQLLEEMTGKTFSELLENGYEYCGYDTFSGNLSIFVSSEQADPATMDKLQQLEGLSLKTLLDNNIYVGYSIIGDACAITASIGSANIYFDVDGAYDIIQRYKETSSFPEFSEMTELHDKTISNVTLSQFSYTIVFDEASQELFSEEDLDFSLSASETPEEILKDCVIKECSYTPIPDELFQ